MIEVGDLSLKQPVEGEALLRVVAVGLCGSDAHWFETGSIGDTQLDEKLVLGHEFTAVIDSGERTGERVVVDPAIPCLACEQCIDGRANLCSELRFAGHVPENGALAAAMNWPERCLVPLPDTVSDEVGTLSEPLGVALHAIDLAGLSAPTAIGVVGCGPVGLLTILALRATRSDSVAAVELLEHRRRVAGDLGAEVGEIQGEPEVVFETAGTDEAVARAVDWVRPGGRILMVGIPSSDITGLVASRVRRKELTLVWCRRMAPGDLNRAVELIDKDPGVFESLVTERYDLSQTAEAFEAMVEKTGVKVVVHPSRGLSV